MEPTLARRGRAGTAAYAEGIDATDTSSPRARGRPRRLTENQIVVVALRLAATTPLRDVPMRDLAAALGVQPPTLYNYVASKDALQQLVVDHILREVVIPGREEGPWKERMRRLQRSARQALADHPGIDLGLNSGLPSEGLRLADGVMSILTDGGFDPAAATQAFSVLYTFMLGQREVDTFAYWHRGHGAPLLEEITDQDQRSRDELFEFAFEVLLDGLEDKLVRQPSRKERSPRRHRT